MFQSHSPAPQPHLTGPFLSNPSTSAPSNLAPPPARPSLLKKLVRRTTYAATQAEYALASQLGYEGFLNYQLNPSQINNAAAEAKLLQYWSYLKTSAQLWAGSDVVVIMEMQDMAIVRAAMSDRQLYERIVEFWSDHFNIYSGKSLVWNLMPVDREKVIRQNALTTFPQLLKASTMSPAMLHYLDNQLSTAANPNQNFARELMELHTLGVDNGYTQQDVKEVARCLTGWGYYNFGSFSNSGTFYFNPAQHDNGTKTVLGHTIAPGGGLQDGLTVIDILSNHPYTAAFIAKKLCKFLLGENVRTEIIEFVKDTYLSTGGDIPSMVRAALRRQHLEESELKWKRPFHLFSGILRSLNAQLNGNSGQHRLPRYAAAGHLPFDYITPNGAPDTIAAWSALMLPRWNFAGELLQGVIWDTVVNTNTFFAGAASAADCVAIINNKIFLGDLDPFDQQKLTDFLAVSPSNSTRRAETLALALSAPQMQWY